MLKFLGDYAMLHCLQNIPILLMKCPKQSLLCLALLTEFALHMQPTAPVLKAGHPGVLCSLCYMYTYRGLWP